VRRVDELFALADSLDRRRAAAFDHVETLSPTVLAKAFRGELVPQDPNDEPAEQMLEKIRIIQENDRSERAREQPRIAKAKSRAA
jgi:type I restriction enzyme S subunit